MILENNALSMAESLEYVKKDEEGETDVVGFIKKFATIKPKDAKEMRKKLEDLKLLKIKDRDISKIIDFLPEDQEDLNKLFDDVNLDEDESKKILDIVKEYK